MKVTQYQALAEPLPNDAHPDLSIDKWFAPTQQPYPYPKSRHATGTWVVGIFSFAGNITVDKWFPGIVQPYPYPKDPRARQTGAIIVEQTGAVITSIDGDMRCSVTVTRQSSPVFRSSVDATRAMDDSLLRTAADVENGDAVPIIIDLCNPALR